MPAFCLAHGCTSTGGRDDVIGRLLSGDDSIGPRPSHSSEIGYDDIAAEPVDEAGPSPAYDSAQVVETPPQIMCEQHQATDKSVQVCLLTHNEASQANEKKILSTSATQTEPQAVSSGSLSTSSRSANTACLFPWNQASRTAIQILT
nr:uncharacterized protein LOC119161061 isoform X3 [Rhipicephalus microplus]